MFATRIALAGAAASVLCLLAISGAVAEEQAPWGATVGLGAAVGPDYPGSDEYAPVPLAMFRIERGPYYLALQGPGLRANLVPSESFNAGPTLGYGGGRDDVDDSVVDRLPEVDAELWTGAFASYTIQGLFDTETSLGFQLEVAHDVMGDSGTTATFAVEYGVQATRKLSVSVGVAATWADSDHADAYFTVTPAGAAASGLPVYRADSGIRDYTLSPSGMYAIDEHWGVGAMTGVTRLTGDAADSPIVSQRGDATGLFGGAFVFYRF